MSSGQENQPQDLARGGSGGAESVQILSSGPDPVVRLHGDLDAPRAPRVLDQLRPLLPSASEITIECSDVTFCDSAGLRCLLQVREEMPAGATVALVQPSGPLARLLDITGLRGEFVIR